MRLHPKLLLPVTGVALVAGLLLPGTVWPFCNENTPGHILECPKNAGGHKLIIEGQYSGFMRDKILGRIVDQQIFQDTSHGFTSSHHVDGCEFKPSTTYIKDQYDKQVLPKLDPNSAEPFAAATQYG